MAPPGQGKARWVGGARDCVRGERGSLGGEGLGFLGFCLVGCPFQLRSRR